MDAWSFAAISKHANNCPNCGNDTLGEGCGTLEVKGSLFKRTCECGFLFEYDVRDGVQPKKVKQAVQAALAKC